MPEGRMSDFFVFLWVCVPSIEVHIKRKKKKNSSFISLYIIFQYIYSSSLWVLVRATKGKRMMKKYFHIHRMYTVHVRNILFIVGGVCSSSSLVFF